MVYFSLRSEGVAKLAYEIGALLFGLVFITFNCLLYSFYDQLSVAFDIITAAGKFLMKTKRILWLQIGYIFIGSIISFYWLLAVMYLYSLNKFHVKTYESGFTGKVITWDSLITILMIYKTFLFFWILSFLQDNASYVITASVTSYYFSSGKNLKGKADVEQAIKLSFCKHAGSIALGSLIHKPFLLLRAFI